MAILTVSATTNFSGVALSDITGINFTNTLGTIVATFGASQFNGLQISPNVAITGSIGRNAMSILAAANFDASGWTFSNWLALDSISITGTTAADTIIGSRQRDQISSSNGNDVMRGGEGQDKLQGGAGNDTFVYGAVSEIESGEEIYGGTTAADSGTADAIRVTAVSQTQLDFSTALISGIEQFNFDGAGVQRVKLTESQLLPGGGSIASFSASVGFDEVEVLMEGGSINLGALNLTGFGASGGDTFVIKGGTTDGGESVIASDADDIIFSSGGADVIAGGLGNDTFKIQNAGHVDSFVFLGSSLVEPDTGLDTVEVGNSGNYDLTVAGFAGIDRLQFSGLSNSTRTVLLNASQVGAGKIKDFVVAPGGNNATTLDSVVISGGSVDLSTGKASGVDAITINGSTANDVLAAASHFAETVFTINGLDGDDTIAGGETRDILNGDGGNDTFLFNNISHSGLGTGDTINGGAGSNDRILFSQTSFNVEDFAIATITGIELFEFAGGTNATQTAAFLSNQLQSIGKVTGDIGDDVLKVVDSGTVDLSALTFTNFESGGIFGTTFVFKDFIEFKGGTTGVDKFTGSSRDDLMRSSGGKDIFLGGDGNDKFILTQVGHNISGFAADLGAGTGDTLRVEGGGTLDIGSNLRNFENLDFSSGDYSVTIVGTRFGAGRINHLTSTGGTALVVIGNTNLSTLNFGTWGNGSDSITINGTTAGNSLIGSARNDIINADAGNDTLSGGLGFDILNGGAGNDRFVLNTASDIGDEFHGGADIDTIVQAFSGNDPADLTTATLESIEAFEFAATGTVQQVAKFQQVQVSGSGINTFIGNAGNDVATILFEGASLDLSALVLSNWTEGEDRLVVSFSASTPSGNLSVTGSSFGDSIILQTLAGTSNTISTGGGADIVTVGAGDDSINGGEGADSIDGGSGNDVIAGGAGADTLVSSGGSDIFIIEVGDFVAGESIEGFGGATLRQLANGTVDYTTGLVNGIAKFEFSGTTTQTAILNGLSVPSSFEGNTKINNLVVNYNTATTAILGGPFTNWTDGVDAITINGSGGGDILTGSVQRETINGSGGSDTLKSSAGFDALDGGIDDDTILILAKEHVGAGMSIAGGAGTGDTLSIQPASGMVDFSGTTISGIENLVIDSATVSMTAALFALSGINKLSATVGSLTLTGGSLDLSSVDMSAWIAGGEPKLFLTGSATANTLIGSSRNDFVSGLGADDVITGGEGADILDGGDGNDTFVYTAGSQTSDGFLSDTIIGGTGTQDKIRQDGAGIVNYTGMSISGVEVFTFLNTTGTQTALLRSEHLGASKIARIVGDAGINEVTINAFSGAENFNLSGIVFATWTNGTDKITFNGSGGSDTITGSALGDILNGFGNDDVIDGGSGNDTISGGLGTNRLIGGAGVDQISGGDSIDTFVLQTSAASQDFISGFIHGVDNLEVSAAAFGGGLSAFIGLDPSQIFVTNATGLAGDADDRFIYNTTTNELIYDSNGTGAGNSRVIATFVDPVVNLSITDFNIVS